MTGGAGYIGSHAALALIEKGYNIVIFESLENGHKQIVDTIVSLKASGKVVDFIQVDLKNLDDILKIFNKNNFGAVLIAYNRKASRVLSWSPKRCIDDSIRTAYSWILKMKEDI